MKPELPKQKSDAIIPLLRQSRERHEAGDLHGALQLALEAWGLIPEPKAEWNFYPQIISRAIAKYYVELNDKKNFHKWIEIVSFMYEDRNHEDYMILLIEGEAMRKFGDRDRAFYIFDRIYEIYGEKGFEGAAKPHLGFYREEKHKRNAK